MEEISADNDTRKSRPLSSNPLQASSSYASSTFQPTVHTGPSARWICPPTSVGPNIPSRADGSANPYSFSYEPLPKSQPGGESLDSARTYKCRWCERYFAHESSKCRHEKEHFNRFPCPEPGCDVVSSRKDSLKRHLRLMHGEVRRLSEAASLSLGAGDSQRQPNPSVNFSGNVQDVDKEPYVGDVDGVAVLPFRGSNQSSKTSVKQSQWPKRDAASDSGYSSLSAVSAESSRSVRSGRRRWPMFRSTDQTGKEPFASTKQVFKRTPSRKPKIENLRSDTLSQNEDEERNSETSLRKKALTEETTDAPLFHDSEPYSQHIAPPHPYGLYITMTEFDYDADEIPPTYQQYGKAVSSASTADPFTDYAYPTEDDEQEPEHERSVVHYPLSPIQSPLGRHEPTLSVSLLPEDEAVAVDVKKDELESEPGEDREQTEVEDQKHQPVDKILSESGIGNDPQQYEEDSSHPIRILADTDTADTSSFREEGYGTMSDNSSENSAEQPTAKSTRELLRLAMGSEHARDSFRQAVTFHSKGAETGSLTITKDLLIDEAFERHTLPQLAKSFAPNSWIYLSKKAGGESAIRYALKALGAIYSVFADTQADSSTSESTMSLENRTTCLLQYNRAIKHVLELLEPPNTYRPEIIFICTFFFACIEILLSKWWAARRHGAVGLHLLKKRLTGSRQTSEIIPFEVMIGDMMNRFPHDLREDSLSTHRSLGACFVAVHSGFLASTICGTLFPEDASRRGALIRHSQRPPNVNLRIEQHPASAALITAMREKIHAHEFVIQGRSSSSRGRRRPHMKRASASAMGISIGRQRVDASIDDPLIASKAVPRENLEAEKIKNGESKLLEAKVLEVAEGYSIDELKRDATLEEKVGPSKDLPRDPFSRITLIIVCLASLLGAWEFILNATFLEIFVLIGAACVFPVLLNVISHTLGIVCTLSKQAPTGEGRKVNSHPRLSSPRNFLQTQVDRMLRPRLPPGYRRIEWVCDCGRSLYGDFENFNLRAVEALAAELQSCSAVTQNGGSKTPDLTRESSQTSTNNGNDSDSVSSSSNTVLSERGSQNTLSSLSESSESSTASCCDRFASMRRTAYFELCVNTGEFSVNLGEINIQQVTTDGDLFQKIWKKYREIRGWRMKMIYLKPCQIQFVYVSSYQMTLISPRHPSRQWLIKSIVRRPTTAPGWHI